MILSLALVRSLALVSSLFSLAGGQELVMHDSDACTLGVPFLYFQVGRVGLKTCFLSDMNGDEGGYPVCHMIF